MHVIAKSSENRTYSSNLDLALSVESQLNSHSRSINRRLRRVMRILTDQKDYVKIVSFGNRTGDS